jgi:hypothetical protein
MTPPAVTTEVVKDCAEAGIRHVWMHQGMGRGAASPARSRSVRPRISVVSRRVPLMYLPGRGSCTARTDGAAKSCDPRAGWAATPAAFRP